jgi:predicted dehydrogenase
VAPLRLGVIGLGFGEYHVRTIATLEGAVIGAVADTERPRVDRIAALYGAAGYRDGLEMMKSEKLDAVSICVSPKFREPLITYAAENKIPMFIEKPWATNTEQALRFRDMCSELQAKVLMGFSFRFHPAVQKLLSLVDGELGKGWLANGEYVFEFLPPETAWLWDPENGNGIFNENSCHLFDVLCSVMGRPESLFAHGGTFVGRPSEEAAAVSFRFEGGGTAAVTIGGLGASPFRRFPRLDVCTEKGRAELSGSHHTWQRLDWGMRGDSEMRSMAAPPEELGSTRYTHAFSHFLDIIRGEVDPIATIDDGILSVSIAEAVYHSIRTREPVDLTRSS